MSLVLLLDIRQIYKNPMSIEKYKISFKKYYLL